MVSSSSAQNNNDSTNNSMLASTVAAGLGLAAVCVVIALLMSSGNTKKGKTMKAPGRNTRIDRKDFEGDAKGYFRELRGKRIREEPPRKQTPLISVFYICFK
ncbi:hypothetical protein CJ030_MR7G011446 [Morella rubra]|uniref:Uncharacterized protein n=1 Tax=Morella rubra TaxID=262757 RepID=A0A6A1V361_9ROSI|nr:hypothetical protein CJ030_MR7G011446 [Morella rubra]